MKSLSAAALSLAVLTPAATAQSFIPGIPALPSESGALLALWTQFVAAPGPDTLQRNSAIELRYVLMGGDADCGAVTLDQQPAGAATAYKRAKMDGQFHVNSTDAFTVSICAARLDPVTDKVMLRDAAGDLMDVYTGVEASVPGPAQLGRASGDASRITGIALGDSGCRGMDPAETQQDCSDPAQWPLKELAGRAADLSPDFVLHVGDYHYFWEKSGFWLQNGGTDRFEYWMKEILLPAASLMRAAPWMMARGNHEQCPHSQWSAKWFGDGWHAMFSPSSLIPLQPAHGVADHCKDPIPPTWYTDLAPADGSALSFRFLVADTARGGSNTNGFLDAANASVPMDGGQAGWITHYPPIKLANWSNAWHNAEPAIQANVSSGVADAVSPCMVGKPCMPSVVFAGHQHFFQEFDFSEPANQPVVLIVGHGGTQNDPSIMPGMDGTTTNSSTCTGDFTARSPFPKPAVSGEAATVTATVRTAQVFGFVHLSRDAATTDPTGWDRVTHWAGTGTKVDFATGKACPKY